MKKFRNFLFIWFLFRPGDDPVQPCIGQMKKAILPLRGTRPARRKRIRTKGFLHLRNVQVVNFHARFFKLELTFAVSYAKITSGFEETLP